MNGRMLVGGLALGIAGIAAHSLGVGGDPTSSLASPYPLPLVIPAFLGVPSAILGMAFGLAFAAWSHQLVRHEEHIPRRSVGLFAVTVILSALGFIVGWRYGIRYQGRTYVFACVALSVAMAVLLTAVLLRNSDSPSVRSSAAFHFVLFAWLATYAMPYLGEGP
jgi:hypothetical protein